MPKIEIGPDGSPVVVPDEPATSGATTIVEGTSFVVEKEKVPESSASIPSEAIPTPVVKTEPTGMDKRIEDAKVFNEKLKSVTGERTPLQSMQNQTVDTRGEIKSILKRYGMDSQQQEKAFAEIVSLLGL